MTDMVNNPPHYNSHPAGIDAIEVIRHATDYNLGTAMKYIWRVMWGGKHDNAQDIRKAIWYLQDWERKHAAPAPSKQRPPLIFDDPSEERDSFRR